MGSTNKTTNLELSQFLGTDKPSWLNDYNADMLAIDSAVGTNVTDISTAQSRADSAYTLADNTASSVSTLSTQVTSNTTDIATAQGNITTINSLIGNGTPTTTDQTIIGAINEINANSAIELVTSVADGVKTSAQVLESISTYIAANIDSIRSAPYKYTLVRIDPDTSMRVYNTALILTSTGPVQFMHGSIYADSHYRSQLVTVGSATASMSCDLSSGGAAFSDTSSNVLTSGITYKLVMHV